ncbi:MAG: FAD-binding oxidoreductase [Pseudomonadota bacterium]
MNTRAPALLAGDDMARDCSYYAAVQRQPGYPRLLGRRACDVAVVGGGLAGLSAAIELADRGFRVTLLEARTVGNGASGRNGGQALTGLACDPHEIEAQLGRETARDVWSAGTEALALLHERRMRFAVECEWRNGYLWAAVNRRRAQRLRTTAEHLQRHYGQSLQVFPQLGEAPLEHVWAATWT